MFEDDEEIIKVRRSKLEEWRRLEEDVKKKQKGEKEIHDKNLEILKKNKELANKVVTADSNGLPIFIKSTFTDKLLNDFLFSRSIISDKAFPDERNKLSTTTNEKDNQRIQNINQESLIKNKLTVNLNTNKINTINSNKNNTTTFSSIPHNRQSKISLDKHVDTIKIIDSRYVNQSVNLPSQITFLQPVGSNYEYILVN